MVAAACCPKGFNRCIAWDGDEVRPTAVAGAVVELLLKQGRAGAGDPGIAIAL